MKLRWALFGSILSHACLWAVFYFSHSSEIVEPTHEVLTVEVIPSAAPKGPTTAGRGGGSVAPDTPRVGWKDILPSMMFSQAPSNGDSSSGDSGKNSTWGAGGADLRHMESASGLQTLATELDGAMSYPDPLAERGYSGAISASLYFQQSGGCDWHKTKIWPGEVHLRVYVLALLKKVCSFGQIERLHLPSADHADLSFNFRLVSQGEKEQNPLWITGNVIALERVQERSVLRLDLGPLRFFEGDIVHVNFEWIFDQWDHLMGDKKDPLAPFQE